MNRCAYVLLMSLLLCAGCHRTHYARDDTKERFKGIAVGDQVDTVYAKLGVPLAIGINPDHLGQGSYFQSQTSERSIENAKKLMRDPRVRITLSYSMPKGSADNYYKYEVRMVEGRVTEV